MNRFCVFLRVRWWLSSYLLNQKGFNNYGFINLNGLIPSWADFTCVFKLFICKRNITNTALETVHEGIKPFKCSICDVKFAVNNQRNIKSAHKGKKQFKCDHLVAESKILYFKYWYDGKSEISNVTSVNTVVLIIIRLVWKDTSDHYMKGENLLIVTTFVLIEVVLRVTLDPFIKEKSHFNFSEEYPEKTNWINSWGNRAIQMWHLWQKFL